MSPGAPRPSRPPRRLVILGAGGHGKVVAEIARLRGFEVAGFLDDVSPNRWGTPFAGATVLGGAAELEPLRERGVEAAVVAIGRCETRLTLTERLAASSWMLPVLTHPSAAVSDDAVIAPGTVIAAGAVVAPGTTIGTAVILNTSSTVDHDCRIGDGAHIGPGAHLGGHVTIGRAAWIGIGAIVSDRRSVGDEAIVGAGSVVVKDVPARVVAYGVPARVVRPV